MTMAPASEAGAVDPETEKRQRYRHPLLVRYASDAIASTWSEHTKFTNWRKLWVALARAEMDMGLDITPRQIEALEALVDDVDYKTAVQLEKKLRHDVMAHVHAYGEQVPIAKGILHLGATSCFVTDNSDLMQAKAGLKILQHKLVVVVKQLAIMADKYKDLPTLGFTHFQPAQLTTVGKRATLWLQDFLLDYKEMARFEKELPFRGVKGTTGTQASFLKLFDGDHDKVTKLNARVCDLMGFDKVIAVSGQTYTRKIDSRMMQVVAAVGESAHKMATDIRLLASMKEIEEPFGKKQIGSSAMAYKRNPMRSERVCALSRYLMNLPKSMADTHATQWFERTLDDSAIRRMVLPEAFLACDGILDVCANIVKGIQVWPNVIHSHLMAELPFMATENVLMECVKHGGDRQELHEIIREMSMEAGKEVKVHGKENDLLDRIRAHEKFAVVKDTLDQLVHPKEFIGRCPEQVDEFLKSQVQPVLDANPDAVKTAVEDLKV